MAIGTVITRGYGNGTMAGSIGLVVTRGYLGEPAEPAAVFISLTAKVRDFDWAAGGRDFSLKARARGFLMTAKDRD